MPSRAFLHLFIASLACLSLGMPRLHAQGAAATQPARTAKTLIVLVGDSTVAEGNGWGPGFREHLVGDIQCINKALNGRSTKSFIDEAHWKETIELKPDFI